jgi:hypothetical protein
VRDPVTERPAQWKNIIKAAGWTPHVIPMATCTAGSTTCNVQQYVPFVYNAEPIALGLQIKGQTVSYWNVQTTTIPESDDVIAGTNKAYTGGSVTMKTTIGLNDDSIASNTTVNSSTGAMTTTVPLFQVLTNVLDGKSTFTICPDDGSGNIQPGCCVATIDSISPLVIDFSGQPVLQTLSLLESHVSFDLLGTGAQHTGWIKPQSAFLALDLDGSGVIDSGKKLFGEGTLLPNGKRAANGFEALAQYDIGHKGYIDKTDPVFPKLLLWRDVNMDGKSEPSELMSLKEAGIERINTSYEPVPRSAQDGSGNAVRLRSKSFGTGVCGATGCPVYDVYFRTWSLTAKH